MCKTVTRRVLSLCLYRATAGTCIVGIRPRDGAPNKLLLFTGQQWKTRTVILTQGLNEQRESQLTMSSKKAVFFSVFLCLFFFFKRSPVFLDR